MKKNVQNALRQGKLLAKMCLLGKMAYQNVRGGMHDRMQKSYENFKKWQNDVGMCQLKTEKEEERNRETPKLTDLSVLTLTWNMSRLTQWDSLLGDIYV